jgi:hypothetical protein
VQPRHLPRGEVPEAPHDTHTHGSRQLRRPPSTLASGWGGGGMDEESEPQAQGKQGPADVVLRRSIRPALCTTTAHPAPPLDDQWRTHDTCRRRRSVRGWTHIDEGRPRAKDTPGAFHKARVGLGEAAGAHVLLPHDVWQERPGAESVTSSATRP